MPNTRVKAFSFSVQTFCSPHFKEILERDQRGRDTEMIQGLENKPYIVRSKELNVFS